MFAYICNNKEHAGRSGGMTLTDICCTSLERSPLYSLFQYKNTSFPYNFFRLSDNFLKNIAIILANCIVDSCLFLL